jgi:hypothetical protein
MAARTNIGTKGINLTRAQYLAYNFFQPEGIIGGEQPMAPVDTSALVSKFKVNPELQVVPHTAMPWESLKETKLYQNDRDELKAKINFLRTQLNYLPLELSAGWRPAGSLLTQGKAMPVLFEHRKVFDTSNTGTTDAIRAELIRLETIYSVAEAESKFRSDFKQWLLGTRPDEEYENCIWLTDNEKNRILGPGEKEEMSKTELARLMPWNYNAVPWANFKRSLVAKYPGFMRTGILFHEEIAKKYRENTLKARLLRMTPKNDLEAWIYYLYVVKHFPIEYVAKMVHIPDPENPDSPIAVGPGATETATADPGTAPATPPPADGKMEADGEEEDPPVVADDDAVQNSMRLLTSYEAIPALHQKAYVEQLNSAMSTFLNAVNVDTSTQIAAAKQTVKANRATLDTAKPADADYAKYAKELDASKRRQSVLEHQLASSRIPMSVLQKTQAELQAKVAAERAVRQKAAEEAAAAAKASADERAAAAAAKAAEAEAARKKEKENETKVHSDFEEWIAAMAPDQQARWKDRFETVKKADADYNSASEAYSEQIHKLEFAIAHKTATKEMIFAGIGAAEALAAAVSESLSKKAAVENLLFASKTLSDDAKNVARGAKTIRELVLKSIKTNLTEFQNHLAAFEDSSDEEDSGGGEVYTGSERGWFSMGLAENEVNSDFIDSIYDPRSNATLADKNLAGFFSKVKQHGATFSKNNNQWKVLNGNVKTVYDIAFPQKKANKDEVEFIANHFKQLWLDDGEKPSSNRVFKEMLKNFNGSVDKANQLQGEARLYELVFPGINEAAAGAPLPSIKDFTHEMTSQSILQAARAKQTQNNQAAANAKATADAEAAARAKAIADDTEKKNQEDEAAAKKKEEERAAEWAETLRKGAEAKAERERKEQEIKDAQAKATTEAERERLEKEQLETERLEKEKAETERIEKERLETERLERERVERETKTAEEAAAKAAAAAAAKATTTTTTTTTTPPPADKEDEVVVSTDHQLAVVDGQIEAAEKEKKKRLTKAERELKNLGAPVKNRNCTQ